MIKETHIVKYVNLKNTLITNSSNTTTNTMRIRHRSCAINAGHRRHVECHSEEKKMKCTVKECPQLFTSRLAIKAHLKLKHSGVKDRIKCKFADNGCEKTFTVKGNMVEHTLKCKFNPDGIQEIKCKVWWKGGFFMPKRILQHKRKAHGWDF